MATRRREHGSELGGAAIDGGNGRNAMAEECFGWEEDEVKDI